MRRRLALLSAFALGFAPLTEQSAFAQGMVVYDPSNVAQNVLQAARALEQVRNQLTQIENEARMLASLDLQLSPEVSEAIASARELFDQAQAIRYTLETTAEDIRALYPDDYRALGFDQILQQSDRWMAQSEATVTRLVEQQARAAHTLETTQSTVTRTLDASGAAQGQTSAIQATNQLLGALSVQLADIQALQIAQSRALAEERLERAAQERRAAEIQSRAFPTERSTAPPAQPRF
jgi:P-type conjugative transfer protein TrbJ